MACEELPEFIRTNYEVHEWNHACVILVHDFPKELKDIVDVLTEFRLLRSHIEAPGGGKSPLTAGLERAFRERGWKETGFKEKREVNGDLLESITHKMDCFKNRIGVEVEWNSKDQTYDRDIQTFRVLSGLGRLSVGVIITRSDELQGMFDALGPEVGAKYGASTTHMGKLLPRMKAGSPCPLLVFGITNKLYMENK